MLHAFAARDPASKERDYKSEWRELFEMAVMESKKGMTIASDLMVVVGQKRE